MQFMSKIYQYADRILDKRLNSKPRWFLVLISFSSFGAVMVPILFKDSFLEQGGSMMTLFVMLISYLIISFLYGLIFGFGSTFIMKHILRFMNLDIKYSLLIKLFQISFLPYIIPGFIYLIRITLDNYFETEFVQSILPYIAIIYLPIALLTLIVYAWVFILLFRGMKRLTALKLYQNVLIYIGSGLVITPLNILLLYY